MKSITYYFFRTRYAFVLLCLSFNAYTQDQPSLLVLGTAHFSNPGNDLINLDTEDILSSIRQKEIVAVVDNLAKFKPTHIAVEIPSDSQEDLNNRFLDYKKGRYELNRSEMDQIGFRLAVKLDHNKIHAVDWNGNPPGNIKEDYDWYSYAKTNGYDTTLASIVDTEKIRKYSPKLVKQSIGQWLIQLNRSKSLKDSHNVYFDIALIGDGDRLIGANWVGTWYARNLKIYSRLVKLATQPDDRILVIFGQGHAYLIRQFARENGVFTLIDVDEVLKE